MNPLFKLFSLQEPFNEFNGNVQTFGWVNANKKLLAALKIAVSAELPLFPTRGALVYANHQTGLDPFLLAAVGGREDSYCVCDIYQTKKGSSVAKHIIPIYFSSLTDFIFKPPTSWPGFFTMRLEAGRLSPKEAKKKNRQSLDLAVEKISQGRVVYLFPSGGEMAFRPWKAGIGYIVKALNEKKINHTLYQVHIKNFSEPLMLYHLLSGNRYLSKNPVRIKGKQVNVLQKLARELSAFELANHLKKRFATE